MARYHNYCGGSFYGSKHGGECNQLNQQMTRPPAIEESLPHGHAAYVAFCTATLGAVDELPGDLRLSFLRTFRRHAASLRQQLNLGSNVLPGP